MQNRSPRPRKAHYHWGAGLMNGMYAENLWAMPLASLAIQII